MRTVMAACIGLALVGCSGESDEEGAGELAPFGLNGPYNDPTFIVGGSSEVCLDGECQCEVFEIVNQERAAEGLPPYKYNSHLGTAAQDHAIDMLQQDYFSHTSLDGRSFSDRVRETPYEGFPSGENIAAGQRNPEAVMESWMNSPGHRSNIMSDGSDEIGVGCVDNMWVQVFGRSGD